MEITIRHNVYLMGHVGEPTPTEIELKKLLLDLTTLTKKQGENAMSKAQEVLDVLQKINQNTNDQAAESARLGNLFTTISERLKVLEESAVDGATKEELAAIGALADAGLAGSEVVESNLKAIGADPENPTPEPEPVPQPDPETPTEPTDPVQ